MPAPNNAYYLRSQGEEQEPTEQHPQQPPQHPQQPPQQLQAQELPPQPPVQENQGSDNMANRINLDSFAGEAADRGDIWWEYFERYAALSGFDEGKRRDLLPFFLNKHAKVWFDALPEASKSTFDSLKTEFLKRFSAKQTGFDIYCLSQGPSESCAEYYTRCQQAMMGKGCPSNIQVMTVIRGLRPNIQKQVMLKNPETMEDTRAAMALVEMADSQMPAPIASVTTPDPMWRAIQDLTASVNALQAKEQTRATEQVWNQNGTRGPANRPSRPNRQTGCPRCNYPYFHSLDNCGAKGIRCTKCKGLNHFSDLCKKTFKNRNSGLPPKVILEAGIVDQTNQVNI